MNKKPLPFLTTHVANIALNLDYCLYFLYSKPAKISNFESVSEESLINDQLNVSGYLIKHFLGLFLGGEPTREPWIEIPRWKASKIISDTSEKGRKKIKKEEESFLFMIDEIKKTSQRFGKNIWNPHNKDARKFLRKVIAQINQFVLYTNRRVLCAKICSQLPDPEDGFEDFESVLHSGGPELAQEIMDIFLGQDDPKNLTGANGYMLIANEESTPRKFAPILLNTARSLLLDEALRRGYRYSQK